MSKNDINTYTVTGHFKNKGEVVTFSRDIRAIGELDAQEKVYLHFGSKHKIRRQNIKFDAITISKSPNEDQVNEILSSSDSGFKYLRG